MDCGHQVHLERADEVDEALLERGRVHHGHRRWGRRARAACRLRQLREDDFVGGLVLREFEAFTSAEVNDWWLDGRCVLVGPHPDYTAGPPAGRD
ncbi:ATP-grasp domain-containing protein [Micromonospora sp. RTP1Z1]|uniref:ATP-grasp domain-containing protein n=1 Tax=Micromonospora sp. RTP1Z1 TaxID=2994043 RepID=UPI0039B48FDA